MFQWFSYAWNYTILFTCLQRCYHEYQEGGILDELHESSAAIANIGGGCRALVFELDSGAFF